MKGKYSKLILEHCNKENVDIPPGFKRYPASHLAVIRLDGEQPKLVAKTFFKKEDLKYYILTNLLGLTVDSDGNLPAMVIDLKEHKSFVIAENGHLIQNVITRQSR